MPTQQDERAGDLQEQQEPSNSPERRQHQGGGVGHTSEGGGLCPTGISVRSPGVIERTLNCADEDFHSLVSRSRAGASRRN